MTLTAIEVDGIREGLAKLAMDRNDRAAANAAAMWLYSGSYYPLSAADHIAQNIALGVACWLRYDTEAHNAGVPRLGDGGIS